MSNTGYLCVTDPMHSIYISRTLNPMHSDYCREMEGDAHAGYLSKFSPRSKESKHLDIVAWSKTVASCMIIEAICFGLYVLVVTEGPRLPGVDSTRTILRISWLGPKCLGLIVASLHWHFMRSTRRPVSMCSTEA